jgi:nucleotide-binding universal stress UspA family protein
VAEGDPADAIIAIAAAEGVDLIVTGVARDEALGRHRLGATVERLARRAPAPVLVVKRRPRPYEEVVVATDFTPASQHALGTVAGLFPDARLTLMHGWEVPFPAFQDNPRFRDDLRAELARHSDAFVAAARIAETRRPALQVLIEHGAPERLIRDYMTDRDIDLAVIGAHSGGAPFEGRLGAVARRILEAAPGDVLIVRELRAERA